MSCGRFGRMFDDKAQHREAAVSRVLVLKWRSRAHACRARVSNVRPLTIALDDRMVLPVRIELTSGAIRLKRTERLACERSHLAARFHPRHTSRPGLKGPIAVCAVAAERRMRVGRGAVRHRINLVIFSGQSGPATHV